MRPATDKSGVVLRIERKWRAALIQGDDGELYGASERALGAAAWSRVGAPGSRARFAVDRTGQCVAFVPEEAPKRNGGRAKSPDKRPPDKRV